MIASEGAGGHPAELTTKRGASRRRP